MDRFVEKLYEVREQIMNKMHEEKTNDNNS